MTTIARKMAVDLAKIGKNQIKSVATGELCRLYSRQLSENLKPQLDAANVGMVGIGLEELGVEEFVKEKFFDGDLYVDTNKKTYQDLGYKRFGIFSVFAAVLNSIARAAISKAKALGISGNLRGDGFQNGGTLVVSKEGKVLLSWRQESPAEHVPIADVLKALGIEGGPPQPPSGKPEVVCDENACQLK